MNDQLFFCVVLSAASVPFALARPLLTQYNSLEKFLKDQPKRYLEKRYIERITAVTTTQVKQILRWAEAPNNHLISCLDKTYPALLGQIPSPPILLYAKGNMACLSSVLLAVVGSRRPSKEGVYAARQFSQYFAKQKMCVVSGMALGIDAVAHEAAVSEKEPTIAVLGSGVEYIYPKINQPLYENILKYEGLVLSEYGIGASPRPMHFPKRNRIISGLAQGVLVVQAGQKSGSLITARLASEQGRHVWVLPGSVYQPLFDGNHYLIREGATLVHQPVQVLEDLDLNGVLLNPVNTAQKTANNCEDLKKYPILAYFGDMPITFDQLVIESQMSVDKVLVALSYLEILGHIEKEGDTYIRKPRGD